MSKKLISIFLCLMLLLALPFSASAAGKKKTLALATPGELIRFAENCRLDSYSQGLQVTLTADIDMTGQKFEGIPIFCGTFDGMGHRITGLEITAQGSVSGFFRYLTGEARVENLTVEAKAAPQGSRSVTGGIVGSNAGTLENCAFIGSVSGSDYVGGIAGRNLVTGVIHDCTAEGTVDGNHFVGGIAGENQGVIRFSASYAQVNTTPQQNKVEIGDITIETLTGSESAVTVTDIGGIAGTSGGVIRACENYGSIGYKHMGYNVGGIAGSQSGYISDCENYGAVSGRKEVGGIVGQMEPVIRMEFSQDTLQSLKEQMDDLGQTAGDAAASIQGGVGAVSGQIGALQNHAQTAQDALEQLSPSISRPEDGGLLPEVDIPDRDSILAAQSALGGSITGMQSSMEGLVASAQGAMGALSNGMQAMMDQLERINGIISDAEENLGGTIQDVSDEDTPEDTAGKVADCENYGDILGDLNAGGIVGAIALETDLDPEQDISLNGNTSLNFDSMLRAVILACKNRGSVTAGKQNTGGIVGWMDLGLVKNSINTGFVDGGDYTGGVVGRGSGYIRSCSAKCAIDGGNWVGGIAGYAQVLTDCRSMVQLDAGEKAGAVAGQVEQNQLVSGNYYLAVGSDPGAIDGISYEGIARGLEQAEFMALEGLSKRFRSVTVTFAFADGSRQTRNLTPGEALDPAQIPEIPEKTGYTGYWEGLDNLYIQFDTTYYAQYTPYRTVIQSKDQRENGKPILLAEGSFPPEAAIGLTLSDELPEEARNLIWQSGSLMVTAAEQISRGGILEVLQIALPAECGRVTYRYLPPETAKDAILLVQDPDGSWSQAQTSVDGSYLVFGAPAGQIRVALVQRQAGFPLWGWAAIGAAVGLAALTAVLLVKAGRKKREVSGI